MFKKYITKIVKDVLKERDSPQCVSEVPMGNNYYLDQRIDRLSDDVHGLANYIGVEKVYGSSFAKINNKGAKTLR